MLLYSLKSLEKVNFIRKRSCGGPRDSDFSVNTTLSRLATEQLAVIPKAIALF